MTTSSLPVIIDEEAAQRIARFQFHREVDLILSWVKENVPDLLGIRVAALRDRRPKMQDQLVIWAYWECEDRRAKGIPEWDFIDWKLTAFPFEIAQKFSVWCTPGPVGSQGV